MADNIEIVEARLFAGSVADEIVAIVQECIDEHGKCSIALAGGSTPASVYRVLSRPGRVEEIDWQKVSLYWGDERWVPLDHSHSNYNMAHETMLVNLPKPGPGIYPVDTSLASPELAAEKYAELLTKNEDCSAEGIPQLDLVLLGVGEDGHTASLFPHSELLDEPGICFAATHPSDTSKRVTMSAKVLFSAKSVLFIVKGASKNEIVTEIFGAARDYHELPAMMYKSASGKVTWFIDSEAAKGLPRRND